MPNILWLIILGLAIILAIEMFLAILSYRGIDTKTLRKRNTFYPFHQFKTALAHPELNTYLGELSDECVDQLFEQGFLSLAKYWEVAPQEIEQICIYHNRKMPAQLDIKRLRSNNPPKLLGAWCPYALLHLARAYVQGKASQVGQQFIRKFLTQYLPQGYQILLAQANATNKAELARIYPDEFFSAVNSLDELQQYVAALSYLTEIYAENKVGPKAKALLEKLAISNGAQVYPLLCKHLYHKDDKQFALDMIQKYEYIPMPMKIEILRCRQGNHFVDECITKLQQRRGTTLN